MQLEALCISLGIQQHIPALSEFRDELLQTTAAALQAKDAEIAAVNETLAANQASLTDMESYKADMVAKVTTALQSGDPAEFQSLAVEFLAPAQEAARIETLAKIAALKAEAAQLEAEIAT